MRMDLHEGTIKTTAPLTVVDNADPSNTPIPARLVGGGTITAGKYVLFFTVGRQTFFLIPV